MKNDQAKFLSYSLALALKDRGFNEPCFAYWHSGDEDLRYPDIGCVLNSKLSEVHIAAPTYQDVIDWFREEHDIRIVDDCAEGWASQINYKFKVLLLSSPDGGSIDDLTRKSSKGDSTFKNYYDALDFAIGFAIKFAINTK